MVILYPLTSASVGRLSPFATLAAVALCSALVVRGHKFMTLVGALVTIEYTAAVLMPGREPLVALAGVGLLVTLELLDLAATPPHGPVERAVQRRRGTQVLGVSVVALVTGLVAQVSGGLLASASFLGALVAVACGLGALVSIGLLARRAVHP
jgi:hypothetical protein